MTASLRSLVAVAVPAALVLSSVGCSTLGRGGKCKSCDSNQVYSAPSYDYSSGGTSAPTFTAPPSQLSPIPVPPAEFPDTAVPPPPTGASAARPNAIQRMQGSTTAFFMNANESVRRAFR